ncbi:MAG: hypothetical protein AB7N91_04180 [Candidatus Tectimicrobiota bacterium]
MRTSTAGEQPAYASRGAALIFLGVLLAPIAPPLGLGLLLSALLPPYVAWRKAHFLPVDARHCLLPRLRPAAVPRRGQGPERRASATF